MVYFFVVLNVQTESGKLNRIDRYMPHYSMTMFTIFMMTFFPL